MHAAINESLGSSSTGEPPSLRSQWRCNGMAMSGSKRRHCSSHLCCSLFFPLNLGNAIRRTGDAGCNVLNVAAMLKEDFDLLAEALVGFVGRAGVRLVHVGVSVVSH